MKRWGMIDLYGFVWVLHGMVLGKGEGRQEKIFWEFIHCIFAIDGI